MVKTREKESRMKIELEVQNDTTVVCKNYIKKTDTLPTPGQLHKKALKL